MNTQCFQPGQTIVYSGQAQGVLWFACPVFVVQDQADLVALYWPADTPNYVPAESPTPRALLTNQQAYLH